MPKPGPSDEIDRIRQEFERRDREIDPSFYALDRPANLFIRQNQERVLVETLSAEGFTPLAGRRLLEVGCGHGWWLATFTALGMRPEDLAAIEVEEARIAVARARFPQADLRVGDGVRLPWADGAFDLVAQFTVFTSILDADVQRRLAAEMWRVTRPGGAIVWGDFAWNNPSNPSVRGIGLRRVRELFPEARPALKRATLAPPIARRLVPVSWTAALVLERLRVFDTHWFGLLVKPGV